MPQGVASWLRPYAQPVRLAADLDAMPELPRLGIEHVHLVIVPARDPQLAPIRAHVPHVGTAPTGHRPRRHHASRPRVEPGDRAGAVSPAGGRVPTAVR